MRANDDAERSLIGARDPSLATAARLLPPQTRRDAAALYAFCRTAADEIRATGAAEPAALTSLQARLESIYAGAPQDFAPDCALTRVLARHPIPKILPARLLAAIAADAEGGLYPDLPALLAHAARTGGTAGIMMAMTLGATAPETLAHACEVGMAMHLTAIARDLGNDARRGRLY